MVFLVGRRLELARFGKLFDEVAGGVGRVLALSGGAGMGKSRLVNECLAMAAERGFVGLRGTACAYHGELSYAPVVEALRPLIGAGDRSLTDGLVDLGRLFEGLSLPAPSTLGDAGLERTRPTTYSMPGSGM
jgi:predicted ATPase